MNTQHLYFIFRRSMHFATLYFLWILFSFAPNPSYSQVTTYAYLDSLNHWVDDNFFKWKIPERILKTDSVLNIYAAFEKSHPIPYITALNNYSSALWWGNRTRESLEMAEKAYQTIQPHKDSSSALFSDILNNRGATYEKIGLKEKAKKDFENAIAINTANGLADSYTNVFPLWNLGDLYSDSGQHEFSRDSYEKAFQILQNTVGEDHSNYALGLQKLAKFYNLIGMYEKALEYGLEARDLTARYQGKESYSYATRLRFLSIFYENLKEYEKSHTHIEEATNIVEKAVGKEHPTYAFYSMHLANALKHLKRYNESHTLFMEARKVIETMESKRFRDLYMEFLMDGLASLYGRTNELNRADTALQFTLQLAKERMASGNSKFYANRVENYAQLQEKLGHFEKAFEFHLESNSMWHQQIEDAFGVLNEYEAEKLLNRLAESFNIYRYFAHLFHDKFPDATTLIYDDALALKSLLLQKSHTVISSILQSDDEKLIANYTAWKETKELSAALQNQPVENNDFDRDSLQQTLDQLERNLVIQSAPFRSAIEKVKWSSVRSELQPHEAAIEFIRYHPARSTDADSTYYAALILRQHDTLPVMVLLCLEEELQGHLNQELFPVQRYLQAIYSERLYELVWAPMEPHLKDIRNIYFSPDGLLHRISFPALPHTDSTYLFDHYQLTYVSSTRNLLFKTEVIPWSNAHLFGDINYDSTSVPACEDILSSPGSVLVTDEKAPAMPKSLIPEKTDKYWSERGWTYIEDSQRSAQFNRLAYTGKEIEGIAMLLKNADIEVQLSSDRNASEECFKSFGKHLKSPSIINLATHGYFFSDQSPAPPNSTLSDFRSRNRLRQASNPLFRSGLALTGANQAWEKGILHKDKEDGILTAYEISNLNLTGTQLAVLSACQTGLGDIKGSEGVYGLQRAFKMAGVDYLLVTLWNIRDGNETVEFVTTFYKKFLSGLPIKKAFYETQKVMRKRYKSPYYWAGFVLID